MDFIRIESAGAVRTVTLTRGEQRNALNQQMLAELEQAMAGAVGNAVAAFAVTAPFAGMVIEKKATLGELASPSEPLFSVADLSRVWIQADLPEAALLSIGHRPGLDRHFRRRRHGSTPEAGEGVLVVQVGGVGRSHLAIDLVGTLPLSQGFEGARRPIARAAAVGDVGVEGEKLRPVADRTAIVLPPVLPPAEVPEVARTGGVGRKKAAQVAQGRDQPAETREGLGQHLLLVEAGHDDRQQSS